MGFTWVQGIGTGASIDAADLTEIRTNVDTVDDEKCAADKVSYDSDYKDGDDTTHNPGYYSNQHDTYESSNYPANQATYDVNVMNIYDSGDYGYHQLSL